MRTNRCCRRRAGSIEPPESESESEPAVPVPAPDLPPRPPVLAEEHDDEEVLAAHEPAANHNVEPPMTGSSFDAALEALQRRMERAKLTTDFVRSLLIVDNVIDVGEAAMKWAGMPNKHERSLTSEVFFALARVGISRAARRRPLPRTPRRRRRSRRLTISLRRLT